MKFDEYCKLISFHNSGKYDDYSQQNIDRLNTFKRLFPSLYREYNYVTLAIYAILYTIYTRLKPEASNDNNNNYNDNTFIPPLSFCKYKQTYIIYYYYYYYC